MWTVIAPCSVPQAGRKHGVGGVVGAKYTDRPALLQSRLHKFSVVQTWRTPSERLRHVVPRRPDRYTWASYGTISRWYAEGKTVRARWSALDASGSLS